MYGVYDNVHYTGYRSCSINEFSTLQTAYCTGIFSVENTKLEIQNECTLYTAHYTLTDFL